MKTVIRFAILTAGIFSVGAIGSVYASSAAQGSAGEQPSIATLEGEPSSSLTSYFATFAGSDANAQDLIEGLRSGSSITLAAVGQSTASFTPPTSTMGYGEVAISLGLAQQLLASYGITDPTPQEIEAALVGGTVTTSNGTQSLTGVLSMRSSGMGWGEIAQKDGVNLGSITSQIHEAGDQGVSQSHTPEAEPENSADASSVEAGHENADTIDASAVNHSDNADLPPNVGRPDVDVERPEIERPDIVRPDIERPDLPGVDH